jgi:hypothetical protein
MRRPGSWPRRVRSPRGAPGARGSMAHRARDSPPVCPGLSRGDPRASSAARRHVVASGIPSATVLERSLLAHRVSAKAPGTGLCVLPAAAGSRQSRGDDDARPGPRAPVAVLPATPEARRPQGAPRRALLAALSDRRAARQRSALRGRVAGTPPHRTRRGHAQRPRCCTGHARQRTAPDRSHHATAMPLAAMPLTAVPLPGTGTCHGQDASAATVSVSRPHLRTLHRMRGIAPSPSSPCHMGRCSILHARERWHRGRHAWLWRTSGTPHRRSPETDR